MRRGALVCAVFVSAALLSSPVWATSGWKLSKTPRPPGVVDSYLTGVSCPTPQFCFAVGSWATSRGRYVPLAERWTKGGWSLVKTPRFAHSHDDYLTDVTCWTETSCISVGAAGLEALVAWWDGTSWSTQILPPPAGGTQAGFGAVSCPTTSDCVAVGSYYRGTSSFPLVGRWNGSSWEVESAPRPIRKGDAYFADVDCTSVTRCVAVGAASHNLFISDHSLIERWNGVRWRIVPSADSSDPRFPSTDLNSVACSSASSCVAVGSAFGSSHGDERSTGLIERWDGTAWSPVPLSLEPNAELATIWCDPAQCLAVGIEQDQNLVERWDGRSWTQETPPAPPAAWGAHLYGIACSPTEACMAVGTFSKPQEVASADRFIP